ncbi:MAG TPA: MarR family transcriptional regulator, partial [Sphingobacteriaceae bacterium]
ITVDHWLVIKTLNLHNDKNQSDLAELIGKDQPTFTRIADLLCKKGLIERKSHETDRRSFIIHLTNEGRKRVTEWSPKMAEIRNKAWENLTENDYDHLRRILNTIYNNLNL